MTGQERPAKTDHFNNLRKNEPRIGRIRLLRGFSLCPDQTVGENRLISVSAPASRKTMYMTGTATRSARPSTP